MRQRVGRSRFGLLLKQFAPCAVGGLARKRGLSNKLDACTICARASDAISRRWRASWRSRALRQKAF
jgi:hypothetical protein